MRRRCGGRCRPTRGPKRHSLDFLPSFWPPLTPALGGEGLAAVGELWSFLSNAENQKTLAWLGGGLVLLVGGVWTVVTFFAGPGRDKLTSPSAPPDQNGAVGIGDVVGRDYVVNTKSGLSGVQALLLIVVVTGAVLLAGGLLGQRITANGSAGVGGDITNSTITIDGGAREGRL